MVCSPAMGQLSNNSPISYYGLGDVSSSALSSDISLGGASTANYSSYMINNLNPSSYSALYTQLADASFVSKQKRITLGTNTINSGGGAIHNFLYAFPLSRRLGMALGLKPQTSMNYEFENTSMIDNSKQLTQLYKGEGGINKLNLGFGYSIIRDSLNIISLGVNINYLFGSTIKTSTASIIEPGLQSYNSIIQNTASINSVTYDFGVTYLRKLNDKVDLSLGATYEPKQKLNVSTIILAASFAGPFSSETIKDLIAFDDSTTTYFNQSQRLAFGAVMDINNKYKLMLDYRTEGAADNSHLGTSYNSVAASRIAIGIQYIPDVENIMKVLKVARYRFGMNYGKTGKVYQGNEITQTAGTFGVGLPLVKSQSLTSFNFGMEIGNRTTNVANSYSELYTNLYIGVSIAPHKFDKWFVRRKIE